MRSAPIQMEPQRTQRAQRMKRTIKSVDQDCEVRQHQISSLCPLCSLWLIPLALFLAIMFSTSAIAQQQIPSKVDVAFNRFYNYDEYTAVLNKLTAAYPELLTLQSIGKSEQGRDMWLV